MQTTAHLQITKLILLLDNQEDLSSIHLSHLKEVQRVEKEVKINGVGGHQFTVHDMGSLDNCFRVYASQDMQVNVLSLAEVEDKYPVTYVQQESFTVHLPDRDIVFRRKGKLYIADWSQHKAVYNSTSSISVYTPAEEARAKQAYELLRTCGYPS